MARILVVDDDSALLRTLKVGLSARGHTVDVALTGEEGLRSAALQPPELVVLDLDLPDIDGLEVLARLGQWTSVPVIVLSANGLEDLKVAALDAGAADYVTKPFGMAELEARIRASIRDSAQSIEEESPIIEVGPLLLDLERRQSSLGGSDLALTSKEFDLLAYLAKHRGKTCTHQMILREIWGAEYRSESEYLRVYVFRLRRKIGDGSGIEIRTIPGIGYCLVEI